MENLFDVIWFKILDLIYFARGLMDNLFSPLHLLGPAFTIAIIALLTVLLTKLLTRLYKTKRLKKLEKEFIHWHDLRQEAMKCEDRDKAKLLSKNIDQARLNRVYYDYFLEGFLNGIATKYLPVLIMVAYVNESYNPEMLKRMFGRSYIFRLGGSEVEPILMGSVFFFIVSIILFYIAWAATKRIYRKRHPEKSPVASEQASESKS